MEYVWTTWPLLLVLLLDIGLLILQVMSHNHLVHDCLFSLRFPFEWVNIGINFFIKDFNVFYYGWMVGNHVCTHDIIEMHGWGLSHHNTRSPIFPCLLSLSMGKIARFYSSVFTITRSHYLVLCMYKPHEYFLTYMLLWLISTTNTPPFGPHS